MIGEALSARLRRLPHAPRSAIRADPLPHCMLLTDDQQALRDIATRFARERLRPGYQQRENESGVDRALCREMGRLGLIGIDLPETFGGMGQSGVTAGLLVEDIAYGDFNVSYVQLLASLMGM